LILLAWSAEALVRRRSIRTLVREGLVFSLVPTAIYVAVFAVHFALLTHSGPGDGWMSPQFQSTLEGNRLYAPGARVSFIRSFLYLNRVMSDINMGWATDKNAAASPWYTWPIAKHSIGFWGPTVEGNYPERWIVLSPNPVVWWGILIGLAAVAVAAFRRRAALEKRRDALLFLAAGFAFNLVPFAFIQRPMYLYHYFFGLIYSLMLAAVGVGILAGWVDDDAEPFWRFPSRRSAGLYVGIIGLAAVSFLYLAPFSYGRPLSAAGVLHRRWILERHVSMPTWLARPTPPRD
jgi:dolichyl-phosphate-mannose-protein mannosyltransferase